MIVHVYPVDDWIEHQTEGTDCPCEPGQEFVDPETELPYPDGGQLVLHRRVGPPEPGDNPER